MLDPTHPTEQVSLLSRLPPVRQKSRWRVGQTIARLLCVMLGLVGLTPFAIGFVLRSAWVQDWVRRETSKALEDQGIHARYTLAIRGFPPTAELHDVVIESSDGGAPFLEAKVMSARPRLFALLSGKFVIEQVEVDRPKARVVIAGGKLANLDLYLPEKKEKSKEPLHLPFDVFAVTDGDVDLWIEGVNVRADEVDLDVTVQDDPVKGSSIETEMRIGSGAVHRRRTLDDGTVERDDDSICSLEGRVRVDPSAITVRRLKLNGVADFEGRGKELPPCEVPATDPRVVELELQHVHVTLPEKEGRMPAIDGHVKVKASLALTKRLSPTPKTAGWISADVDVAFEPGKPLPDIKGHVEAGNIQVDHFSFARSVDSTFDMRGGIVRSERTTVGIADGTVVVTNLEVQPLAKGIPIKGSAEVRDASFNSLMHDLGVSKHPWLEWQIKEVHVPLLTGTCDPLKLDADFTAKTPDFVVYDSPIDHPTRTRMVHVQDADISAHLAIRPDSLQFRNAYVQSPKSWVRSSMVLIGFSRQLEVVAEAAHVDFAEVGPVGGTPMTGVFDGSVKLYADTDDPHLEAQGSISDFVLADMPMGQVSQVHAKLDMNAPTTLTFTNAKGHKGRSEYELPLATMHIGGGANVVFDGTVQSNGFDMRDLLSIFHFEDDPRFEGIGAKIDGRTELHVALGGPEDKCHEGYMTVRSDAHVSDVDLFGEHFEEGDLRFDLRFPDRQAGLNGAELEVDSFSLHKVRRSTDGAAIGSVLGSASILRGGELRGSAVVEGIPLSRVQTLTKALPQDALLDGAASGIIQIGGSVDAFLVTGNIDVTPVRVRGTPLGPSHLRFSMSQFPKKTRVIGKTACGAPLGAPFDKDAYLADTSAQGQFEVDGDLFGGQVELAHLKMTRQKQAEIAGTIGLKRLDLGTVAKVALWTPPTEDDNAPSSPAIRGEISGDILLDAAKQGELGKARATFVPRALWVEQEGKRLSLKPTSSLLTLSGGTLEVQPLEIEMTTPQGLSGSINLKGKVARLDGDPTLDVDAELKPVDLGLLVGVVPKLDRAQGSLAGSLHLGGRAADPSIDGDVRVRGGEFAVHGWPSVVSGVEIDLKAGRQELSITRGTAKFAGGTLSVLGRVPLHGLALGEVDATVAARGLRLSPADGITAGLDADLRVTLDPDGTFDRRKLPHVTGEVIITDFDYTRPVSLSTDIFQGRAQRTEVDTYDPQLDAVMLDVAVRSRAPMRIRNNLAEAQLSIDTGTLVVSGTNQRFGLRGALRALPGGRLRVPFASSVFDIKQAQIRFDDPTRIAPNVDLTAQTEYRRGGDTMGSGGVVAYTGSGSYWRFNMHASGDSNDLKIELTSDPPLSQEDVMLLLTLGMTRAEIEQMRGGLAVAGAGAALEALNLSGASSKIRESIQVIDDFRFGSAYSPRTGRTEPQITVGKRITNDVRAQITTSLAEDRELRAAVQLRLSQRLSVQASYDNVADTFSPAMGNLGLDLRWRLEFE